MPGDDLILCQITSQTVRDAYAIALDTSDFEMGTLNKTSNIRPNRLFTADRQIIQSKIGELKVAKLEMVIDKLVEILRQ